LRAVEPNEVPAAARNGGLGHTPLLGKFDVRRDRLGLHDHHHDVASRSGLGCGKFIKFTTLKLDELAGSNKGFHAVSHEALAAASSSSLDPLDLPNSRLPAPRLLFGRPNRAAQRPAAIAPAHARSAVLVPQDLIGYVAGDTVFIRLHHCRCE
jgi:hypothetical protein